MFLMGNNLPHSFSQLSCKQLTISACEREGKTIPTLTGRRQLGQVVSDSFLPSKRFTTQIKQKLCWHGNNTGLCKMLLHSLHTQRFKWAFNVSFSSEGGIFDCWSAVGVSANKFKITSLVQIMLLLEGLPDFFSWLVDHQGKLYACGCMSCTVCRYAVPKQHFHGREWSLYLVYFSMSSDIFGIFYPGVTLDCPVSHQ